MKVRIAAMQKCKACKLSQNGRKIEEERAVPVLVASKDLVLTHVIVVTVTACCYHCRGGGKR